MNNLAEEIRMYASYLNGFDTAEATMEPDDFEQYKEDTAKAKASMESAYFEASVTL